VVLPGDQSISNGPTILNKAFFNVFNAIVFIFVSYYVFISTK
jgi:hypothetical protein